MSTGAESCVSTPARAGVNLCGFQSKNAASPSCPGRRHYPVYRCCIWPTAIPAPHESSHDCRIGRRALMASSSAVISTLFTSLPLLSHASTLFDTESSLYFSDANENPDYVEYRSVDEGYRIQRPSTWEQLNKAGADAFFRDPQIKKATLGVTVLPVKITTLSQFGSLEQVAEKLESAERAKESTIGVHMVTSTARDTGSGGAYDFIYELESTRGRSTIAASVMIVNSKLYIVNGIVPCWRNKCNDMGGDRLLDRVVASARSLEVSSR